MLKFKTSCAVLAYLSSNLLNEVGLSLFRYFEVGLRVCDIVVNTFTFAISSPDEFLCYISSHHVTQANSASYFQVDRKCVLAKAVQLFGKLAVGLVLWCGHAVDSVIYMPVGLVE